MSGFLDAFAKSLAAEDAAPNTIDSYLLNLQPFGR